MYKFIGYDNMEYLMRNRNKIETVINPNCVFYLFDGLEGKEIVGFPINDILIFNNEDAIPVSINKKDNNIIADMKITTEYLNVIKPFNLPINGILYCIKVDNDIIAPLIAKYFKDEFINEQISLNISYKFTDYIEKLSYKQYIK